MLLPLWKTCSNGRERMQTPRDEVAVITVAADDIGRVIGCALASQQLSHRPPVGGSRLPDPLRAPIERQTEWLTLAPKA
ncbi:hypothetical protein BN000_02968 [Mycobacterium europaeum]|uniref:Uncharacterized protein n=1 Tax=Mycobacterium europaeum TaxID=761804 RepID=A0A0U1DDI2_9MYCO|nr:hypothetical protein BN000_02968 [Mycobacterium europaeum]